MHSEQMLIEKSCAWKTFMSVSSGFLKVHEHTIVIVSANWLILIYLHVFYCFVKKIENTIRITDIEFAQ